MVRLSALTLNIQNGQIWDPNNPDTAPVKIEATLDFLKEQNVDLIFIQEMEFPAEEFPNLAVHPNYDKMRLEFPRYHSCFAYPAATRPHLPFGIGLAIFSRWPLKNSYHVVLPASDVRFEFRGRDWLPAERSAIGAEIEVGGRTISLLNTHLQAYFMIGSSSDAQPGQRRAISTLLRGRKNPLIMGGDFNCTDKEGTVDEFEACGFKTLQKTEITWHRMPLVLDHLFYSSEWEVRDARVVHTHVSDHNAVRAEFILK